MFAMYQQQFDVAKFDVVEAREFRLSIGTTRHNNPLGCVRSVLIAQTQFPAAYKNTTTLIFGCFYHKIMLKMLFIGAMR